MLKNQERTKLPLGSLVTCVAVSLHAGASDSIIWASKKIKCSREKNTVSRLDNPIDGKPKTYPYKLGSFYWLSSHVAQGEKTVLSMVEHQRVYRHVLGFLRQVLFM